MVRSQFSLSWTSYTNNICTGFTSLQQNGEMVDMTLAADGHFVKVHQVLLALASPYLKELLMSAPSQHPILFLNNISHKTLTLLLEYIYTGEVVVPSDALLSFSEAAKALHIKGLDNVNTTDNIMATKLPESLDNVNKTKVAHSTPPGGFVEINVPGDSRKIVIRPQMPRPDVSQIPSTITTRKTIDDTKSLPDIMDDSPMDADDDYKPGDSLLTIKNQPVATPSETNIQYTMSIRGCLQTIFNRYMYNLQSKPTRQGIRRWRCVDYRNRKCTACLVTKDNAVMNRENLHNHPFHDQKILSKIKKKAVYSAIDDVKGYKEEKFGFVIE